MSPSNAKVPVRPLEVETEVTVTVDETLKLSVKASGRTVKVTLDNLRASLKLARRTSDRFSRIRWMMRLQRATEVADVEVQVIVVRRVVAELSATSRVSLLSQLLGLRPVTVRPLNAALACLRGESFFTSETVETDHKSLVG